MRIVIAGAGDVGFHLAKLLSNESKDIYLVDKDSQKLNNINEKLDVICAKGDATSIKFLKEIGVGQTDLLICVTESQNTNIIVATLSKKIGVKKTIVRITNTEFITTKFIDFKGLGIDYMICPEALASDEIITLLNESVFNDKIVFEKGLFSILGTTLEKDSPLIGKSIQQAKEIFKNVDFIVIALKRNHTNQTIIPRGNTLFEQNDQVYFSVPEHCEDKIPLMIGKKHHGIKDVMILGGSKIGQRATKALCKKDFNVKLIEYNKEKAYELADEISDALIIAGDGRNVDLLKEESIENMDAFVAVTGNSEANIMSCLVAKSKGVKKTIALIENMDYIDISQTIGIDTLINKKLLAASAIFRHVRKGKVLAIANLHNVDAEVLEFFVQRNSQVTKKPIKDIKLKNNVVFGGVIRNKKPLMTFGDFQIQKGDRAIVFCLSEGIEEVENLFKC